MTFVNGESTVVNTQPNSPRQGYGQASVTAACSRQHCHQCCPAPSLYTVASNTAVWALLRSVEAASGTLNLTCCDSYAVVMLMSDLEFQGHLSVHQRLASSGTPDVCFRQRSRPTLASQIQVRLYRQHSVRSGEQTMRFARRFLWMVQQRGNWARTLWRTWVVYAWVIHRIKTSYNSAQVAENTSTRAWADRNCPSLGQIE
jgi:hypothetical protein